MELKSGSIGTLQSAGSLRKEPVTASAGQPRDRQELAARKVAGQFEELFVGMMLKSMRETVGKDPLTDGGHGEEVFRSLMDQEYARIITEHGGIGLAALLEKQLLPSAAGSGDGRTGAGRDTGKESVTSGARHENRT